MAVAAGVALVAGALHVVGGRPDPVLPVVATGLVAVPLAAAAGGRPALAPAGPAVLRAAVRLLGLAGLAVAAFLVVAVGPAGLPRHGERTLGAWALAAALVTAALAPAAVRRLDGWADGLGAGLAGGVDAPSEGPLRAFGGALTRAVPMDELLLQLAETVRRSFARRRAEVWLLDGATLACVAEVPHRAPAPVALGDRRRPVAALGRVTGGAWVRTWLPELVPGPDGAVDVARLRCAPLASRGELLGVLVAERTPDEPPFGDDDDRALADLARQVGTALRNVQLDSALQATVDQLRRRNAELQDSRARLVAVADAERRRLERDLHDGAQQHLTALAVKLQLIQALADDPVASAELTRELRADLEAARDQLRAVAHGIFPPLLSIGGLRDALPGVAARAPLPVTVDVATGRHAGEIEAAVYFCCSEALQNAAKHAGPGASAAVRVWDDGDDLRFCVTDDGAGFDAHPDPDAGSGSGSGAGSGGDGPAGGQGLVNMADRTGALGGELSVTSVPGGGTTVTGRLPLGGRGDRGDPS